MVKHTQRICRQIADELFECVWPFCEIGAKKVNKTIMFSNSYQNVTNIERLGSTVYTTTISCNYRKREDYGNKVAIKLIFQRTPFFNPINYFQIITPLTKTNITFYDILKIKQYSHIKTVQVSFGNLTTVLVIFLYVLWKS